MPHKIPHPTEVDVETGDFVYPPTSPADLETPGSKAFGSPTKAKEPWTSKQEQTPGGSSAVKPSQTRQRQRHQKSKRSFLDTDPADPVVRGRQAEDVHLARNTEAFVSAHLSDVQNLDVRRPAKVPPQDGREVDESFRNASHGGQNIFSPAPDNDEDQDKMSDRPPMPKPSSRLTSSCVRRLSDASDKPALPQSRGVVTSRQRHMSDASTIDERPKRKGVLNFSSGPPSVTESIGEKTFVEPLQKTSHNTPADRRKSIPKFNNKVKLSALELEDDEQIDEQSDDPFDQANIPPSRGVSPGPSKQTKKKASKKREAPAPTRSTRAVADHPPVPQNDVVYISSATESRDSDTDDSDSDEYVDKPVSTAVQGTNDPPKTRNTRSRPMAQNGAETTSRMSLPIGKREKKQTGNGVENGASSKPLPNHSAMTAAVQAAVPKTEPAGESQLKKIATAIEAAEPPLKKTVNTRKQRSDPKGQISADETGDRSSASKSVPLQLNETKPTLRSQAMPQNTKRDRTNPISAVTNPNGPQGQQPRATRGSRANQSKSNPGPSKSEAAQNKTQAKPSDRVMDPSPKLTQGECENHNVGVKNKDRKANIIAFGADGPKNNGKSRNTPSVAGKQSEQQASSTSRDSNASNGAKPEHSPIGSHGCKNMTVRNEAQSTSPSGISLAQRPEKQQPFTKVKRTLPAIQSAVEPSASSEKQRAHGSRATQKRMTAITRKPSTIIEEGEDNGCSSPQRALNGRNPARTQIYPRADSPKVVKHADVDDMAECRLENDPINGPGLRTIPDSLEQLDELDTSASVSQLRDAAMISNMVCQDLAEDGSSRKRPLPDEGARRFPINEQYSSQAPINSQVPSTRQQPEQQILGIGKDSAKMHLQDMSMNFQRPSKRTKLNHPEPNAMPHLPMSNNEFCVPANGYSSDDVFAPKTSNDDIDVDHGVVEQLRGIGPVKHSAVPGWKTHRHIVSPSDKAHELPRQGISAQVSANASHSGPMRHSSSDSSQNESPKQTNRSGLWRQSMMKRRIRRTIPNVKQKERVVVEDPEAYEGVEDMMHRIVAGVLQLLNSKESEVHQVVDDYKTAGSRIVLSIAATHANERKHLIEEYEKRRLDYIRICETARRQIGSIGTDLQGISLDKIAVHKNDDKALDRLKRLSYDLPVE